MQVGLKSPVFLQVSYYLNSQIEKVQRSDSRQTERNMNSSELESSDSNSNDKADFQRFQGIWNNIKKAKESSGYSYQDRQSSQKSAVSVKKAIEREEHKNIQTRLMLTEKQLRKSKENTTLLLKKLSEAEEQIEYMDYELQKELKIKQQHMHEINQYKRRLEEFDKKEAYEQSSRREQISELETINRRITAKDREIDRLTLKVKSLEQNIKSQQKELRMATENSRICQRKMEQTERQINETVLETNKAGQLLELQEASNTIQRLMILLRGTEEYKHFALGIQDFRDVHFLRNIQARLKKNELLQKLPQKVKPCSCLKINIYEKVLWTPAVCYKKALQLKMKYERMTEPCIQELLFEFNKIYTFKQERAVQSLKQHYEGEINRLKKRTEMRYDELVARKQIQRLKKQIVDEKYHPKRASSSLSKSHENNSELELLKAIGQYEDEIKLKERENALLKERIELMENQNSGYDRMLYLEGTLWIIDKVLLEIEANSEEFLLFENQFRDRINDNMNEGDWMDSFKYFMENVTEIQKGLIEKLLLMKESTVKKMGVQNDMYQEREFTREANASLLGDSSMAR